MPAVLRLTVIALVYAGDNVSRGSLLAQYGQGPCGDTVSFETSLDLSPCIRAGIKEAPEAARISSRGVQIRLQI